MLLKELFDIEYGQRIYHDKSGLEEKGNTPLISSKGTNDGIYGWFNIKPKYKHVISVPNTGTVCHAYYQGYDCCIDDNCLVMIPKKELSIKEMIYISLLIRKDKIRYFYGRQVTPERLGNTEIKFNLSKFNNLKVPELKTKSLTNNKIELNVKSWKNFKITELFEIKKGERLIKEERINGNVPLITATSENNGVVDYISYDEFKDSKKIFQNKLTVDMFFNVFYHNYEYFSDDNVHTLIPKNASLNKYVCLFLATTLKKLQYKYDFGRQVRLQRLDFDGIKLPVDKNKNPDWQFMENYIKSLPYSSNL